MVPSLNLKCPPRVWVERGQEESDSDELQVQVFFASSKLGARGQIMLLYWLEEEATFKTITSYSHRCPPVKSRMLHVTRVHVTAKPPWSADSVEAELRNTTAKKSFPTNSRSIIMAFLIIETI